jgi:hypothetical protein
MEIYSEKVHQSYHAHASKNTSAWEIAWEMASLGLGRDSAWKLIISHALSRCRHWILALYWRGKSTPLQTLQEDQISEHWDRNVLDLLLKRLLNVIVVILEYEAM